MAKKYYDGDITLKTDWGGDESTGNLPVVGKSVQKVIKDGINSKVGYVGRVEKTGQGFYVLARDEESFNEYEKTINDENPFGDLTMEGINGRFDAPFNYKMDISVINPENGYKSTLIGSTGNVIKFRAETLDSSNTPMQESVTITYKIKTEGGVESTYTLIYDSNIASKGIEYNLDDKLSSGINTITITAVGMNTGVSAMRRITYRLVDINFTDSFEINKRYAFSVDGVLPIDVTYSLKGIGKTRIEWYFDGNLNKTTNIANNNPNLSNAVERFYFTEQRDTWTTTGVHSLQIKMICLDTDSGEEFQTPIYYREFIIEKTPSVLNTPYIVRKTSFDSSNGILSKDETPTLYNIKQFENIEFEFAAYYNGKRNCTVSTFITYPSMEMVEVLSEELPLADDSFSEIKKQIIIANEIGASEITLRAKHFNSDEYTEVKYYADITESDMNIISVTDSLALSLSAFGRSNNSANKDSWEYEYVDEVGKPQKVTTTFSKNEYVLVSNKDKSNIVIAPSDATELNSKLVDVLPTEQDESYKYLIFNGEYYIWTREFDWSNTSGWSDNKLKLSNGNAITINYKPFSSDKIEELTKRGGTYEFEFETTNVYKDNAVICQIAGTENFAPGITIYASGAELVISREVVEPEYNDKGEQININAGYIKAVSTKYKAEESNRISFVITPNINDTEYRDRILKIYVNGEICGAYPYERGANFINDSSITFRGSEDACINISSVQIYKRALSSNEILNNYIYYRNSAKEKSDVYKRNDIMLENNDETFDSDKLKSQLPIMTFYQIDPNQSLDDIHQEKKNKKLTRFFDVVYIDIQNPHKNFLIKNAYVTPQGTSSMNYPVKNLRLYSGKKDDNGYYSRMFVGNNIFIDGSPNNLSWDNINLDSEVKDKKRRYSFRDEDENQGQKAAAPVNCWCLKADFAESSSSHNTGTARFWNNVLSSNGLLTKAQTKAAKYQDKYPYDTRTCIDGFPIAVFYQSLNNSSPRFEGKYNFNNDKSTEAVFGFTGGEEIDDQEVKYFYIGTERPIIHGEEDKETGEVEYACSFEEGGYTETPTKDSPLYVSDDEGNWYMLRGKELLDNPKMECWELLNSVNEIALFKTMKGFGVGDDDEKIGIVDGDNFDEAFESRYPDCGDYYHYNSLKRFGEWLVSCRYLDIDSATGESVPFKNLPQENYHKNNEGKLSICSLNKKTGTFKFDFPNYNFYREVSYNLIASNIKEEGYQQITIKDEDVESLDFKEVFELPTVKDSEKEYIKYNDKFYTWLPSNVLTTDILPEIQEVSYDYVKVGEKYYVWDNTYKFEDYHETQFVDDTAFNRALKFAIEKYDHIEMDKMAAYYIYLMRFGGVDQTVKNSMLTTEGPGTDDPSSTLPSLWYFINYDNDTILGVKNDGRLVFDPYITRQTKDGTGYVYAGRESTLWNNLEADKQFMEHVTSIDNILAKGEGNSLFALSYSNAIREYDKNQSDKWCERIYNKDAERKYIQTYVEGWVQKNDAEQTTTHVFEDYLYDVQGSRSAHRKWWLGRRFNVFDSRFCNENFRNQLIKFRSTNLPSGSNFTITSGEPVFYAWGHDNSVTEITPTAIQPGDNCTFTTKSAFNIGSYLEVMGSANISTFNLRNCVGALTEIDINGCYSTSVGTKMKELFVGDNNRTDLINNSNTSLKFSGLDKAIKLEVLDMTNIKNAMSFDGLEKLLNIREVYAKGTSVSNFTFADGAAIEKIELPTTVETLSLTRSPFINYDNIIFEDNNYGKLTNLSIVNCGQLMKNSDIILSWIENIPKEQRQNLSLNLQGIDWKFNKNDYQNLFLLENVGTSGVGRKNIFGNIEITARLDISDVVKLKSIFGEECFKEGSQVYIKAPTGLYINLPSELLEGESDIKCEITTVGTTLSGNLQLSATVNEIIDGEVVRKIIDATDGIITMDESNLSRGYVTINIKESNNVYEYFIISAVYTESNGNEIMQTANELIKKRTYPESIEISTTKNSYNIKTPVDLNIDFTPNKLNDKTLIGRGIFDTKWEMVSGSTNYENSLRLLNSNNETAQIQAPDGFDGDITIKVTIIRKYDNKELCYNTKKIQFTNPDTIITAGENSSNPGLAKILVNHGIIKTDNSGFGKLTKTDAAMLTMEDFIVDGKSIFENNKELTSFIEFQYFSNTYMGQMPVEGVDAVVTPNNMFKGCTELKEIAFSDNFKYTANNMFAGCLKLEHIYGKQVSDNNGEPIYTDLAFEYVGDNFASGCTKLKTCILSSATKYIGKSSFQGCNNIEEFYIPTGSDVKIIYDNNTTPFQGCTNIMFTGAEYGGVSEAKYKVKDGACYEINDDNTLSLIHMGRNTLMSQIPTDKPVYACAYSMESRKEKNLVVPENIIFNGQRILCNSEGDTIELKNIIGNNYANYLFEKTKYTVNYKFANGETNIPSNCFADVSVLNKFIVPYGIKTISGSAFYGSSLTEIELPETLEVVNAQTFWLTKLKNITFNGDTPPLLTEGDFFACMLENLYVKPSAYENYKNSENIPSLFKPFLKINKLYNEGYVRIIKDGNIILNDENNTIKVGGIGVVNHDDYMYYTTNEPTNNKKVTLNNEEIGEIDELYTTIYLGDNSSLFEGNGISFEHGIFNDEIKSIFDEKRWFYDKRFKGVRSNPNFINEATVSPYTTEVELPSFLNDNILNITFGKYSRTTNNDNRYAYIKDKNENLLFRTEDQYKGYDRDISLNTNTESFIIGFTSPDSTSQMGINGIVLNKIGKSLYSDPIINTPMKRSLVNNNKIVTVSLNASIEIPNNVYVTLTDNKAHTYRKYWNGEPLLFTVPFGYDFEITASDFVSENHKKYFINKPIKVDGDFIELVYDTKSGIELNNNIICYYGIDRDWFVDLTLYNDSWGTMNVNIEEINVNEILTSDSDGYNNTIIGYNKDINSIFGKALDNNNFPENIIGYIPSYIEYNLFALILTEINKFLIKNNKQEISINNYWVSESFDKDKAWSTTNIAPITKDTKLNYLVFGRYL